MTKATELLLMFYKTLQKSMNHLTRTEVIKQETIVMSDGSSLLYNIDITLQTQEEFSIAYHKIKDASNVSFAEAFELEIRHLLSIDKEPGGDDPEDKELEVINFYKEGGHKQEVEDLLTADDYPESAE